MSTIETRLITTLSNQLGVDAGRLKPETKFVDDLGADSLDEIELVMAIEDAFEIAISDDDAEKIKTVQQAIDYLVARGAK